MISRIDASSIHKITSGQVVIDLQTAVKELLENSLDAAATNIEVRFKQHGLQSIEVIDNGSGIPEPYHDSIALKHHTSKLASYSDLATVRTFGFRGEALSSLCALSQSLNVTTATEPPMGVSLDMDTRGAVHKRTKIARQRGTTVSLTNLFQPLPVRRKEFERNSKREFSKALGLLNAYALGPCCTVGAGVRLTVSNQQDKGTKTVLLRTLGSSSPRAAVSALWGPKATDNLVDLDLTLHVEKEKTALKRLQSRLGTTSNDDTASELLVSVKGLISNFSFGSGRTGTDRQFLYVNGRPCNLPKIQKAFNEVYRSFNTNQSPFILADFILPTDACDINVSPDKRTIFLHGENNLISELKAALEMTFAPSRATYEVKSSQMTQSMLSMPAGKDKDKDKDKDSGKNKRMRDDNDEEDDEEDDDNSRGSSRKKRATTDAGEPSSSASSSHPPNAPAPTDESPPINDMPQDHDHDDSPDLDHLTTKRPIQPQPAQSPTPSSPSVPLPLPSSIHPHNSTSLDSPISVPGAQGTDRRDDHAMMMDVDHDVVGVSIPIDPAVPPHERLVMGTVADTRVEEDDDDEDGVVVADTSTTVWSQAVRRVGSTSDLGSSQQDSLTIPMSRPKENEREKVQDESHVEGAFKSSARRARTLLKGFASGAMRGGRSRPGAASSSPERDEEEDELDELEEEEKEEEEAEQLESHAEKRSDLTLLQSRKAKIITNTSPPVAAPASSSTAIDLTSDIDSDPSHDVDVSSSLGPPKDMSSSTSTVSRPEVVRTSTHGDVTLRFDLPSVTDTWSKVQHWQPSPPSYAVSTAAATKTKSTKAPTVPAEASISNTEDDEKAAAALSRIIDKEDFASMDVVGQFNLGFIVARRQKPAKDTEDGSHGSGTAMDDLFIVDQHAADEKYNFETLQRTTTIQSQKLFKPQTLELTASDELVAIENLDVLRQNGFEVQLIKNDDNAADDREEEEEDNTGARLQLTAQPVSKSTVFDMKGAHTSLKGPSSRTNGSMFKSKSDVRYEGVSEERYDWYAVKQAANVDGGETHVYDGPAMELSAWQTDYASSLGSFPPDWLELRQAREESRLVEILKTKFVIKGFWS